MTAKRSSIYHTMRGGQIVFHYIRMTLQVLKKNFWFFMFFLSFAAVLTVSMTTEDRVIKDSIKYSFAFLKTNYMFGGDDITTISDVHAREIKVRWRSILASKQMKASFDKTVDKIIFSFWVALAISIITLIGWFHFLAKKGRDESSDDHIRGAEIGVLQEHNKKVIERLKLRNFGASDIAICGAKMPPFSHVQHLALVGSPGVGKSSVISSLLTQYRASGNKCFVLDPSGDFTRKFYREGKDIILSPRDKRTVYWDVWSEGANPESYAISSSSLIADSGREGGDGNDFFIKSARFVFEAVCERVVNSSRFKGEKPTLSKLTNYILRVDDDTLIDIVKHSDAKSVLNQNSSKTAAAIRSTMATFLSPLAKLPMSGENFSFREWIEVNDESWIFVPIQPAQRAYYAPIISMWMEHLVIATLSREPNCQSNRVMNLVCDELPSYRKIPSLPVYLAESRKYLGNAVLGFQNRSQMESVYGDKGATTIEGLIGTFAVARLTSVKDSDWGSKLLMSADVERSGESLSIGSHDIRDSVSISKSQKEHRLVTASQLNLLEDLEFYIRFGKGYDLLHLKQNYVDYPDIAAPIVPVSSQELEDKSYQQYQENIKKEMEEDEARKKAEAAKREQERQKEEMSKAGADCVPPIDSYHEIPQSDFGFDYDDYAREEAARSAPKSPDSRSGEFRPTDDMFTKGF